MAGLLEAFSDSGSDARESHAEVVAGAGDSSNEATDDEPTLGAGAATARPPASGDRVLALNVNVAGQQVPLISEQL